MEKLLNDERNDKEKIGSYNRLNSLFLRVKGINNNLLAKSSLKDFYYTVSIEDAMFFYISSFSLSFINNVYLDNDVSLGHMMNMRCIIEGVSILRYLSKTDREAVDLFRLQSFILERNIYNKYREFDGQLFNLNKINFDYRKTESIYKERLNLSASSFKRLKRFRIPFINVNKSFEEIVEIELGKKFRFIYRQLSLLIHPHSYQLTYNLRDYILDVENDIITLLESLFSNVQPRYSVGLAEEYNTILGDNAVGILFRSLISEQTDCMYKVVRVLMDKKQFVLSTLVQEYVPLLYDFMIDTLYGYTEHGTTKLKVLLELLAVIDVLVEKHSLREVSELLNMHTKLKLKQNADLDVEDMIEQAYTVFNHKQTSRLSYEMFKKRFTNKLGFLVDENGTAPTFKQITFALIDKYSKSINNVRSAFIPQTENML